MAVEWGDWYKLGKPELMGDYIRERVALCLENGTVAYVCKYLIDNEAEAPCGRVCMRGTWYTCSGPVIAPTVWSWVQDSENYRVLILSDEEYKLALESVHTPVSAPDPEEVKRQRDAVCAFWASLREGV